MGLWELFLNHRGRVAHKWKHYFPAYERHFRRFRNQPCVFLEIGCGEGGSLQLWKAWLGPYATVVGIDIRAECKAIEEDQIHIRIGDQGDPVFLDSVLAEFGVPDVVLDDGSHRMDDMRRSFDHLYGRLRPGAVYAVEDLHTAYWPEYGGGLRVPGSFIEHCKTLMDELNADHARGVIMPSRFTRETLSMHLYDSMIVFEKGMTGTKFAPQTGQASGQ